MSFEIIKGDAEEVATVVNEYLDRGYKLHGNCMVVREGSDTVYVQAVARRARTSAEKEMEVK